MGFCDNRPKYQQFKVGRNSFMMRIHNNKFYVTPCRGHGGDVEVDELLDNPEVPQSLKVAAENTKRQLMIHLL